MADEAKATAPAEPKKLAPADALASALAAIDATGLKKLEESLASAFAAHGAFARSIALGHPASASHIQAADHARAALGRAHAGIASAIDALGAFSVKHEKTKALHAQETSK